MPNTPRTCIRAASHSSALIVRRGCELAWMAGSVRGEQANCPSRSPNVCPKDKFLAPCSSVFKSGKICCLVPFPTACGSASGADPIRKERKRETFCPAPGGAETASISATARPSRRTPVARLVPMCFALEQRWTAPPILPRRLILVSSRLSPMWTRASSVGSTVMHLVAQ